MKAEDIKKAKELRRKGLSYAKIGEKLGVNWQTIRYNVDPAVREKRNAKTRKRGETPKKRTYNKKNRSRSRLSRLFRLS